MSWAVGYDDQWKRDVGYGVPAICDHPLCGAKIDRGLAHVCGGEPHGGDYGCGLYFCSKHLSYIQVEDELTLPLCERNPYTGSCELGLFEPTPDVQEWIDHKLIDPSWAPWRVENPKWVITQRTTKLVKFLLAQGEGNDHGAPPEVHLHLKECTQVIVHEPKLVTENREHVDYSSLTANLSCPHLPDLCGFEYSDIGQPSALYAQMDTS